jgi:hypothetical protein
MRNAFPLAVLFAAAACSLGPPAAPTPAVHAETTAATLAVGTHDACVWRQIAERGGTASSTLPVTVKGSEWKLEVVAQSGGLSAPRQDLTVQAVDQRRRTAGWAKLDTPGITEMEMEGGPGTYSVIVNSTAMRWNVRALECG